MKIHVQIWVVFLIFLFKASHTIAASSHTMATFENFTLVNGTNLAKPGCNTTCGDLIVPYPFGIGFDSNCSIGKGFDIDCNYYAPTPPKATFTRADYSRVKLISDSTVRISNNLARTCYDKNLNITSSFKTKEDFSNGVFTVSDVNRFTVIGCDVYAWLTSRTKSRNVSTGCMVFCSKPEDVQAGECSGNGCCQSPIPKDISYFKLDYDAFQASADMSSPRSFNPCIHAFVGEENVFKFNGTTDLSDISYMRKIEASVPIVLDWAIGNLSCAQVEKADDYACKSNSECVDSTRETGGYRCICKRGYEGNPYLSPGCQDINECKDVMNYPCYGICTNTEGNYTCNCKSGYYGYPYSPYGCRRRRKSYVVLQLTLGAGIGIVIIIFSLWLLKVVQKRKLTKRRERFFKRNGGLLLQQQIPSGEGEVDQTKLFSETELEKATGQFNRDRILGKGGQGTVYKGMLGDGRIVAVKKSILVDERQVEIFINEVSILSKLCHPNVVKLLGCCLETKVPMLVYEFVPNGTLFEFIHDENYMFPTLWNMRLQIGVEIAGALAHLHSTTIPVYHRDIKSSNILLDEKFKAKLSDFGISKSVSGDRTHLSTNVIGTPGYVDPEYIQSRHLTEKSDVYSFGVVLLELLIGKKPIFSTEGGESRSLATLILSMEDEEILKNVDDRVLDASKEKLIAVANLAKRCLNLNGTLRPKMRDVEKKLQDVRMSR